MATETLQVQPWKGAGAIPEAGERLRNSFMAPKPHPWRPTMGYENVELMPLPALTMTNKMMEPVCTPAGMITDGLRFPNIVTGFDKNPSHAARAALYTRYTPYEWVQNALSHYNESDTNRNIAERVRADAFRLMRMTDEKTACDQRDSGRRLGERITDTTFWRNEVATELEKNMIETNLLQDTRRAVEKAYQDTEAPLHIAQECLYHREHRQGIDLVHDQPEQYILKEIENLKECQMRLSDMKKKIVEQLRTNRAAQHELETDVKSKESALAIDSVCHHLNNFSRGINYYGGIERYDATVSTPDSWAEHSNRIVTRSQAERSRSSQMRLDADNLINACASEIWNSWNDTNSALSRRSTEVLEAKNKTQMHLHRVQQEIFDVKKSIELLRKAIMDKSNPMKVAQTRLEARSHRKDIELCKDDAQSRLVREVEDISDTVESLHKKMQEAESQHQQLLMTKSRLEADLHVKVNSLFIDREKCLGMRRSFPITANIKF